MDEIDFPYSAASSATFIPQNDPLGRFTTRIIDSSQIVSSYETLWHDYMRLAASEYVPMPYPAQLVDPLASLVATDIVVAFETFLRELDETLAQTVGDLFKNWPERNEGNIGRPYGFFFYDLMQVRNHFIKVFGIDVFHNLPLQKLTDYVKFRHIYAHRNGFPHESDREKFQYFNIHQTRRLLINVSELPTIYKTFHTSAIIINNRIANVVLPKWLESRTENLDWQTNEHDFERICQLLSYFSSVNRDKAHLAICYQTAVEEFVPQKANQTGLLSQALSFEQSWRRINLSDF